MEERGASTAATGGDCAASAHVTIRGLTKRFTDAVVYDRFDLDIPRGKLVSVFGPNGCGKSTLINMIAGLIPADAGEILFDGKPLRDIKFGYVFQNYREALFPWLRAIDNIQYPLKLMKLPKAERRARGADGRQPRRQDRPQPLSLRAVGRPAAARLDHAGARGGTANSFSRRAVLGARLRDDAVHARPAPAHLRGDGNDDGTRLARPRGGGLSRRPHSPALAPSGMHCRLRALRRRATPHRRDAVAARLRPNQGALPRHIPAGGSQGMTRFDPYLPIIGVVGLIVVWYLAVWYQVVDPVLLPSPIDTFRALWSGMTGGRLGFDFMRTLERTILATLIAAAIAIPLGILLGASEKVYRSVEFVVDFFRSTPASAMFPLFLVLFGVGDKTKVSVAAFGAALVILFNVAYGVMHARKTRLLAAKVMGASRIRVLTDVMLLESLPQTFVGLRNGVSLALVIVVVAEMFIGSTDGLGQRVFEAQQLFAMPDMYAAIFAAGGLGYGLNLMFLLVERQFVHWSGK